MLRRKLLFTRCKVSGVGMRSDGFHIYTLRVTSLLLVTVQSPSSRILDHLQTKQQKQADAEMMKTAPIQS